MMMTLRRPSTAVVLAIEMTSSAWSRRMDAPSRRTSWTSGCTPRMTMSFVRSDMSSVPLKMVAANARAASSLPSPSVPRKKYACTGFCDECFSRSTAPAWPTTLCQTDVAVPDAMCEDYKESLSVT